MPVKGKRSNFAPPKQKGKLNNLKMVKEMRRKEVKESVKRVEVSVMKIEEVDGKKTGKKVVLWLDPEELARTCETESMVRRRVLNAVADARVFDPKDLSSLKLNTRELLREWRMAVRGGKEKE